MKYDNKTILKALKKISRKKTFPIVDRTVFLNASQITATDLDTFITVQTPETWTVNGDGVVPLDLISRAMASRSVEITFNGEKYTAVLDGKTSAGPCRLAEDFPTYETDGFQFLGKVGASSIASVLDFVSKDEYRYAMTGVYIGEKIVATNGHFLRHRFDGYDGAPFILRAEAAAAMSQFWGGFKGPETTWSVRMKSGRVMLTAGSVEINSATINETYPNYGAVIPKDVPSSVTIKTAELLEALKSVKPSVSKSRNAVEFAYQDGKIILTAKDDDVGARSDVAVPVIGSKNIASGYRMGFNLGYLETVSSNVHSDALTFEVSQPNRAAVINGDILLMPVMLQQ